AETRFLVNEKAKAGIHQLPGGVLYNELVRGQGKKPSATGRVRVKYVGRFADGSVFDESATPVWFKLDSVIAGWRIALQEMPVGSKWRLVIPSAQAYGAEGAGDLIAPYSPLVFELELLEAAD
ncbi:MAG: FKBP-type peptidyl-prolyl cis-trans isomerase, partial [Pseudomonas sp.]